MTRLSSFAAACLLLATTLLPSVAAAQTGHAPMQYAVQAMRSAFTQVKAPVMAGTHGFPEDDLAYATSFVNVGGTFDYGMFLRGGEEYLIAAGGDEDAHRIAINIRDAAGKVVASEAGTEAGSSVLFTPAEDGTYMVAITLAEADAHGFCAFTVVSTAGYLVAEDTIPMTAMMLTEMVDGMVEEMATQNIPTGVLTAHNRVSICGTIIANARMFQLTQNGLGTGAVSAFFTGAPSEEEYDLNLQVVEGEEQIIAEDWDAGSPAVTTIECDNDATYTVNMINSTETEEARWCMMALLRSVPPAEGADAAAEVSTTEEAAPIAAPQARRPLRTAR